MKPSRFASLVCDSAIYGESFNKFNRILFRTCVLCPDLGFKVNRLESNTVTFNTCLRQSWQLGLLTAMRARAVLAARRS